MGGEAMSQFVRMNPLRNTSFTGDLEERVIDRGAAQGSSASVSWEQVWACGTTILPIGSQRLKHEGAQYHEAGAGLAVANVQKHSLAINVLDMQGGDFKGPKARAIGKHEDGAVLFGFGGLQEGKNLSAAENGRQTMGRLDGGNISENVATNGCAK
jgi:hypothetical protein